MTREQAEQIVIQIIWFMALKKREYVYGIGEVNALCVRWKLDWSLKDGILLTENMQYTVINHAGKFYYDARPRT